MTFLKNKIITCLRKFGYRIHRIGEHPTTEIFNNLATAYEQSMIRDGSYIEPNNIRLKLMARLLGTPPSEAYFIVDGIARTKGIQGAVCEFGVAQGETSALIANEILSTEKDFHLFDSFEGLPEPSDKDELKDDIFGLGSMQAYAGSMACPEELVASRLQAVSFPERRAFIHKGFIESVFKESTNLPDQVSFAYLDFDFYEPIKIGLEFLDKRMPVGAIVVVDDYDFFSTGAKTAVDEFLDAVNALEKKYECFVPDKAYGCFAVLTKLA